MGLRNKIFLFLNIFLRDNCVYFIRRRNALNFNLFNYYNKLQGFDTICCTVVRKKLNTNYNLPHFMLKFLLIDSYYLRGGIPFPSFSFTFGGFYAKI